MTAIAVVPRLADDIITDLIECSTNFCDQGFAYRVRISLTFVHLDYLGTLDGGADRGGLQHKRFVIKPSGLLDIREYLLKDGIRLLRARNPGILQQ